MTKNYAMSSRNRLSDFIFVALLAFVFPLKTYAQVPNLGTAINFAVFTTIGALNNVQTSDITGDIGTNNGLFLILVHQQLLLETQSLSMGLQRNVLLMYKPLTMKSFPSLQLL
jgi:hypothetical protein